MSPAKHRRRRIWKEQRARDRQRKERCQFRPRVEALEDRRLLAAIGFLEIPPVDLNGHASAALFCPRTPPTNSQQQGPRVIPGSGPPGHEVTIRPYLGPSDCSCPSIRSPRFEPVLSPVPASGPILPSCKPVIHQPRGQGTRIEDSTIDSPVPEKFDSIFVDRFIESPNHQGRRGNRINQIILHASAGFEGSTINTFRKLDGTSSHYVISSEGRVTQMVSETETAYHAKPSNYNSIGIELVDNCLLVGNDCQDGTGHRQNPNWATDIQLAKAALLVRDIAKRNGIPLVHLTEQEVGIQAPGVIAHGQVAGRTAGKDDPQNFDWNDFMRRVEAGGISKFEPSPVSEPSAFGPIMTSGFPWSPVEQIEFKFNAPHSQLEIVTGSLDAGQLRVFLNDEPGRYSSEVASKVAASETGWTSLHEHGFRQRSAGSNRWIREVRPGESFWIGVRHTDATGKVLGTKLTPFHHPLEALPTPYHNARQPLDTDNDGHVYTKDALAIVNYLNEFRSGRLSTPASEAIDFYYDTNADTFVTSLDVLLVINHLNKSQAASPGQERQAAELDLLTAVELRALMPHTSEPRIGEVVPALNATMKEFQVNTIERKAASLAQLAHESGELRYIEELASGWAYEDHWDLAGPRDSDESTIENKWSGHLKPNWFWRDRFLLGRFWRSWGGVSPPKAGSVVGRSVCVPLTSSQPGIPDNDQEDQEPSVNGKVDD